MGRLRTYLLFGLKLAISLALLYAAIGFVNFDVLGRRLNALNYGWIAIALIAMGLQIGLVSLRWQRIAECCRAHMTLRSAALYTLVGSFFSQVLPSTVGGDAARIWFLSRDAGTWKGPVYSVLIDRAAGLIWLAVLVLICLPWSLAVIQNPVGRITLILIGAAGAAAPAGLFIVSRLSRTAFGQWKVTRHLAEIATIAWTTLAATRNGVAIAVLSITIHLMTVVILWFFAQAIGSPFTLVDSLLLVPPIILIAAVPISIAGWGLRESAMLLAFTYAGLPESDGLIVSLLFGAGTFVIGLIGGAAWVIAPGHVRLRILMGSSNLVAAQTAAAVTTGDSPDTRR